MSSSPLFQKQVAVVFCGNWILYLLLPPVATHSGPGTLTRQVGENVVFLFNASTVITDAIWGIRDGGTNDISQRLLRVKPPFGVFEGAGLDSSSYAGRVSFVGNLTKGQAWFKITNLTISDTNSYLGKIWVKDASGYNNIPVMLTVIQPASTTSPATKVITTANATADTAPTSTTFPSTHSSLRNKTVTSVRLNHGRSDNTCTPIIAACVSLIILLLAAVVFLLIYIYSEKAKFNSRIARLKGKDIGAYENVQQMENTSRTSPTGKEAYEKISEHKNKDIRSHVHLSCSTPNELTGNLANSLDSSATQLYQELNREQIPFYEPLKKRSGDRTKGTTGDPKAYEQLQHSKAGEEYQSLESYVNVESKV